MPTLREAAIWSSLYVGLALVFGIGVLVFGGGQAGSEYGVLRRVRVLGLRLEQLYFLLDGLLDRLIYLSYGLAAILAFIGAKLILHALHENNLPFINDGQPVSVVEISTGLSLTVIIGVLVVTVVASLVSPAGKAQTAIANARRHATSYLDSEYTADAAERERIFRARSPRPGRVLLLDGFLLVPVGPHHEPQSDDDHCHPGEHQQDRVASVGRCHPYRSSSVIPAPPSSSLHMV